MESIVGRLSQYVTSASLAIEMDLPARTLFVKQTSARGVSREALKELMKGLRLEGFDASELFLEFAPYNGATHIVMGDEEGIELVSRDSAMGRALCKAAYVPSPREINESDFAPPPADVVDIHKHQLE